MQKTIYCPLLTPFLRLSFSLIFLLMSASAGRDLFFSLQTLAPLFFLPPQAIGHVLRPSESLFYTFPCSSDWSRGRPLAPPFGAPSPWLLGSESQDPPFFQNPLPLSWGAVFFSRAHVPGFPPTNSKLRSFCPHNHIRVTF